MSYTTLSQISTACSDAVSNTSGLNSFYMIDEGRINELHNTSYPACFINIPDSSVGNINRGWETYEMECLILKPQSKLYSDAFSIAQYYDNAVDLFNGFISNLMGQRGGDFAFDKESITIERISNFGNDELAGVKCSFNLSIPSILNNFTAAASTPLAWSVTSNLKALFHGARNVNRTANSLNWTSELPIGGAQTIVHSNSAATPTYVSPAFTFSSLITPHTQNIKIDPITFSTADWSVFFKMSVKSVVQGDNQVIMEIFEPLNKNGFRFGLQTSANSPTQDGLPFYKIDDDSDSVDETAVSSSIYESNLDLEPLADTVIGLVNDSSSNTLTLYVDSGVSQVSHSVSGSHSVPFTDARIVIGGAILNVWDFGYRGFNGTISHVAIYDSALSAGDSNTVSTDLSNL